MKRIADHIRLSATDLVNHLGCGHLTLLDRAAAEKHLKPSVFADPVLEVLQQRGFEHEEAYLAHLREQGLTIDDLRCHDDKADNATVRTINAMKAGAEVIVQATLERGAFYGRADVLLRCDTPSDLGDYSYEVVDTKLARETRAGTLLQLSLYSEMVAAIQGLRPEHMYVVTPGTGFAPEQYRLDDYAAYYRFVRGRLERGIRDDDRLDTVLADHSMASSPPPDPMAPHLPTYPEPADHCDMCRWWTRCNGRWRKDDHLSFVAGVGGTQRTELGSHDVHTMASLAALPVPLLFKPSRGAATTYERVREQARVQVEARKSEQLVHELILPVEAERGLARLPEPSPGDVFFDIEGDPFVGDSGLEYLFGWVIESAVSEGGASEGDGHELTFSSTWADDAASERAMFEAFIDEMMARWEKFPGMHIYHYAPYEPGTMKRLMGRYATREEEVDRLLRGGRFVDLYAAVRQGVRASVERYSIKDLEPFFGFERKIALDAVGPHKRLLERSLELGQQQAVTQETRDAVETYNADDCYATHALREWLEELRTSLLAEGIEVPRPEHGAGEPSEKLGQRAAMIRMVVERLLDGVPEDGSARTPEQQALYILAHTLEFFRRESKVGWWEYFRLRDLPEHDLLEEPAALAGLVLVGAVSDPGKKSRKNAVPVHRYSFPPQDCHIREEGDVYTPEGKFGSVVAIDESAGTLDVKKTGETIDHHPSSCFAHTDIRTGPLEDSLLLLAEWVAEHGIDAEGPWRAGRDLLLRIPPRVASGGPNDSGVPLRKLGQSTLDAARALTLDLDLGVLPIQGPPGTGKTYSGARMIVELARAGKKVGITAVSHKVVRHLLEEVVAAAAEEGIVVRCAQKVRGPSALPVPEITEFPSNAKAHLALAEGSFDVYAGTSWFWANDKAEDSVDVLVVDEAGQMSMALTLAAARAARSLVLLGDPRQLEQPMQGSHPEDTDTSALEHLMGGQLTVPDDRGLFLDRTYRLHPDICTFTSELFYNSRLHPHEDRERQALLGGGPFAGAGLHFYPVQHEGNQNKSDEEVDVVAHLIDHLLSGPLEGWRDADDTKHALTLDDILIVAPYNAQVGAIAKAVPGARVGTVDKFQGQEAPVVIYTMATSSPEDAPRGMEFLYSLNRLNVATSRARCAVILVANPRLFEPSCRTPRQMHLANAHCRYLELATLVTL